VFDDQSPYGKLMAETKVLESRVSGEHDIDSRLGSFDALRILAEKSIEAILVSDGSAQGVFHPGLVLA